MPKANKLVGLEVLRFLSSIAVLVWHYQNFAFVGTQQTPVVREAQPFYALLGPFYEHGFLGVQVFFCISGFIFFWKYGPAIAQGAVSPARFFVLRASRLYPLHLLTLVLVALLQGAYLKLGGQFFVYPGNDAWHFLLQLFLASNWGMQSTESFNGPIWSISVEVLAYAVFFITVRWAGCSIRVTLGTLALCTLARFLGAPAPIFDSFGFFFVGGLSAQAMRHFEADHRRRQTLVLAAVLLVLLPLVAAATDWYRHKFFSHIFLMVCMPVLLYVAAQPWSAPRRLEQFILMAGNLTYASYLIHFPLQLAVALVFGGLQLTIPLYDARLFLAYMGCTLLASFFVYRLIEMPAQNGIRRLTA